MENLKKEIDQSLEKLREVALSLKEVRQALEKQPATETVAEKQPTAEPPIQSKQSEFDRLKTLLESDTWAPAANPELICDTLSENEKEERAEVIMELLVEQYLDGLKFLDFGCGEGHIVKKALEQYPEISVGYDIEKPKESQLKWESDEEGYLLTTDFQKIIDKGPYNVILLYDVLDHAKEDLPVDILKKVKEVASKNCKIFLRCHPWCSRHGGHLYHQINKAFVHLVFTEDELKSMGYIIEEELQKVFYPLDTYRSWISEAGLNYKYENVDKVNPEKFFSENPLISGRIQKKFNQLNNFPTHQLSLSFVDYVLNH